MQSLTCTCGHEFVPRKRDYLGVSDLELSGFAIVNCPQCRSSCSIQLWEEPEPEGEEDDQDAA